MKERLVHTGTFLEDVTLSFDHLNPMQRYWIKTRAIVLTFIRKAESLLSTHLVSQSLRPFHFTIQNLVKKQLLKSDHLHYMCAGIFKGPTARVNVCMP